MDNLELRIAALKAAGWTVKNIMEDDPESEPCYHLHTPDGQFYWIDYPRTETEAWANAPAVELSVDAALRWLLEGVNYNIRRNRNGPYWVDIEGCIHIGQGESRPLAEVICMRYLKYKGVEY